MPTKRVTFLTTPNHKAALAAYAALNGKPVGHVVREATSRYIAQSSEDGATGGEAELAALVAETNAAIPQMRVSIDRMIETLDTSHRKVDAFLREAGRARECDRRRTGGNLAGYPDATMDGPARRADHAVGEGCRWADRRAVDYARPRQPAGRHHRGRGDRGAAAED